MRAIPKLLISAILTLAGSPALSQRNPGAAPDDLNRRFSDTINQRVGDILNPSRNPVKAPAIASPSVAPATSPITQLLAPTACAIPLLKAAPPSDPVPMPGSSPKRTPPTSMANPIDRMIFAPHMPACTIVSGSISVPNALPKPTPPAAP